MKVGLEGSREVPIRGANAWSFRALLGPLTNRRQPKFMDCAHLRPTLISIACRGTLLGIQTERKPPIQRRGGKGRLMADTCFQATAWNNGQQLGSGAGYGLRISAQDRDRFFHRSWGDVTLHLQGYDKSVSVNITPSFWRRCSELRSQDIGRWLVQKGHVPWERGDPPRFRMSRKGEQSFDVADY